MLQSTALTILKSGKNVFLTWQAGSGKTYVINQYVRYLRSCGIRVAVTASTGIAATHIGGTTIHSRSGIGIREMLSEYDIDLITQKEHIHNNINNVSVLIIDEISMLSSSTLDMINTVVQNVRRDWSPFGGLQVVLCGDFFQLPPITNGMDTTKRFAFASQVWKQLDLGFCYLDTQHRQTDEQFSIILDQLRIGSISEESTKQLQTRIHQPIVDHSAVKLFTHNIDVDRINQQHLDALEGDISTYPMKVQGDKKLLATLKKWMLAADVLSLKVGAQVIFLKNNPQKNYRNGTTGQVVWFDTNDGYPLVQITPEVTIKVEPEVRSIESADEVLASVKQIPLKLARAITVHKSQGMTLEAAEMDLSRTFEPWQAYVALSRVRSLQGLSLLGLNTSWLVAHPLVVRADKYFRSQSDLLTAEYELLTTQECTRLHETYITTLWWVYNTDDVSPKEKSVRTSSGKNKPSTLEVTIELIKLDLTFEEIAKERWLTQGTILQHIFKIKKLYPEVNLKQFKPNKKLLDRVKKALKKAKEKGSNDAPVGLKLLYELLDKELSYDEIKLCLVFT